MSDDKYVYFIYSSLQMTRIMEANKKVGRDGVEFGKVIVNGTAKTYTDIVTSVDRLAYADSLILIQGPLNTIKYTEPKF